MSFLAIVILPALVVLRGQRQEVKVDTSGSPLIMCWNVKTSSEVASGRIYRRSSSRNACGF